MDRTKSQIHKFVLDKKKIQLLRFILCKLYEAKDNTILVSVVRNRHNYKVWANVDQYIKNVLTNHMTKLRNAAKLQDKEVAYKASVASYVNDI